MIAVNEVMSTSAVTVTPTTSVADLLSLFDRHDFNAFPVLGQDGELLGIVSKLDVLELFLTDGGSGSPGSAPGSARVKDLMRHEVVSVEARDSIAAAGATMVANKLRSLPVVERRDGHGVLVGILSRGDILRGLRFQLVEGSFVRRSPAS
jgi:CBS domain-containing protein